MQNNVLNQLIPYTQGLPAEYVIGSGTYYHEDTNYSTTYMLFGTGHGTVLLGVHSDHPNGYTFVSDYEFATKHEIVQYIQQNFEF